MSGIQTSRCLALRQPMWLFQACTSAVLFMHKWLHLASAEFMLLHKWVYDLLWIYKSISFHRCSCCCQIHHLRLNTIPLRLNISCWVYWCWDEHAFCVKTYFSSTQLEAMGTHSAIDLTYIKDQLHRNYGRWIYSVIFWRLLKPEQLNLCVWRATLKATLLCLLSPIRNMNK